MLVHLNRNIIESTFSINLSFSLVYRVIKYFLPVVEFRSAIYIYEKYGLLSGGYRPYVNLISAKIK